MTRQPPRFVFVAGLHRTGTSILAQLIAGHPAVSAIENAPVPENEGCYLQGAIPHTAMHGRPGHYATDPEQHHDESSRYNTLETKRRLLADWTPWFDGDAAWRLEKSPVNLTRMRLYQQLFPTCQFVVILRHPQVMAAALGKWVDDDPVALTAYALDAYDTLSRDLAFVHSALVLRYEDLVRRPDALRKAAFAFLELPDRDPGIDFRNGNADYDTPSAIDAGLARRMAEWGYAPGGRTLDWATRCQHPLRAVRDGVNALANPEPTTRISRPAEKEQEANIRQ